MLYPQGHQLEIIQSRLLDVGSAVATPIESSSDRKLQRVAFDGTCTADLETWIDDMTSQLPPLTNFILPSGGNPHSRIARASAHSTPIVKCAHHVQAGFKIVWHSLDGEIIILMMIIMIKQ
jgi:hypothetical protein